MRSSTTYRLFPISLSPILDRSFTPTVSQLMVHPFIGIWVAVYEPQPSDCHGIVRLGKRLGSRSGLRCVPYLFYPYMPVAGPNKHIIIIFGCIIGPVLNSTR